MHVCMTCTFSDEQIKIWRVPEGGLVEDLHQPSAVLSGHTKRLGRCQWHPTASDILLSVACDLKVHVGPINV